MKIIQILINWNNFNNLEVIEYAKYLGMDLQNDKDLFYIAREGLKAPLPEPWRPVKHPSGEIFYLNLQTKEA